MLLLCSSNPGRVGYIFFNGEGKAGALILLMVKAGARPGWGRIKLIKWAEKWGCPGHAGARQNWALFFLL